MKASKKQSLTRLFALAMLIGYAINGKAQAFDGDDDCKLHAGYINFGKQRLWIFRLSFVRRCDARG